MKSAFFCILFGALGALPGIGMSYGSQDSSFLGIALMGGIVGLVLGATPIFYRTSITDAIRRVGKGVARTLIEYNVGDLLDLAGMKTESITADEPEAKELIRDAPPVPTNFHRVVYAGMIGAAIAGSLYAVAVLGIGTIGWHHFVGESGQVKGALILIVCMLVFGMGGAIHGAAIGMMIVPGRHRLRILGAVSFGLLLGLGLRLAVGPPKTEWGTHFGILVPVTICAAAGVFAPESRPDGF